MEQVVSCAEGRRNKSAAGDAGVAAGAELVRTPPPTTTVATAGPNDSTSLEGSSTTTSNEQESANQMQLLNLRNQVKRFDILLPFYNIARFSNNFF